MEALKLSDVQAIHGRAEDYGRKEEYREQFDLCFSRAVANLATLSEYCIPFVKKGGFFISYKSAKAEEEMQGAREAVRRLGGEMQPAVSLYLPGTDVERCFVSVDNSQEISAEGGNAIEGAFKRQCGGEKE